MSHNRVFYYLASVTSKGLTIQKAACKHKSFSWKPCSIVLFISNGISDFYTAHPYRARKSDGCFIHPTK